MCRNRDQTNMKFKLNRSCTLVSVSLLTAFLLAVIIVIWTQYSRGTFSARNLPVYQLEITSPQMKNNENDTYLKTYQNTGYSEDKSDSYLKPLQINYSQESRDSHNRNKQEFPDDVNTDVESNSIEADTRQAESHPGIVTNHNTSFPQGRFNKQAKMDVTYVKPLKIDVPIADYRHHGNGSRFYGQPPMKRVVRFRHKQADIWDENPVYEIEAFGKKMYLELRQNHKFVSRNLHVTHSWSNYSYRKPHDRKLSGCFYTGRVQGDENSYVAVSLCNGMTGYIRTSEDNFYIEPALTTPEKEHLHILRSVHGNMDYSVDTESNCHLKVKNTTENHATEDVQVKVRISNQRKKRSIYPELSPHEYRQQYVERNMKWSKNNERRQRKTEYFIKVLVVADVNVLNAHGSVEELEHFILMIMSNVASLYEEMKIDSHLSLSVVDIHILRSDMSFTEPKPDDVVAKFCDWQRKNTVQRQHDAAILLVGNDAIQILGTAYVASMCNPGSSCAVIQDRGLSTSYTIAHEIGHLLGMLHDEDQECNKFFHKTGRERYIMSQTSDTKPWLWSPCSRDFLLRFLKTKNSKCLLVPPKENFKRRSLSKLPGELFEGDEQCQLQYGSNSHMCHFTPLCEKLWCYGEEGVCQTSHSPWAEGTRCGTDSLCHRGECVSVNRNALIPVSGGWGPWEPWGQCSRTCGGGIKVSKRYCDSPAPQNGGMFCSGTNSRYASCNTQPCEQSDSDFRKQQCARFNGNRRNFRDLTPDVRWIPMHSGDKTCRLYCKAEHSDFFTFEEDVIDGTKCGEDNFGICVSGMCKPGGCDNELGSNKKLDDCGICGGDNNKCEEISGHHNYSIYGYSKVVRIPVGSSNIRIEQRGYGNSNEDFNYLALVDGETGEYILNGNNQISPFEKEVHYAGINMTYSGSVSIIETITSDKYQRLNKDLVLEVLSVDKVFPPDISYKYIISKEDAPRYSWQLYKTEWSECSSVCSGTKSMKPVCIEIALTRQVPDSYCSYLDIQNAMVTQPCNTGCQLMWNVISKDECSKPCGKGIRKVYYNCVKFNVTRNRFETIIDSSYNEVVGNEYCLSLKEPPTIETCYNTCNSTKWSYSQWSQCSKSCGIGIQQRIAKCLDSNNEVVADTKCSESDKIIEQQCNLGKCPVWSSEQWSPCSVTCGKGMRTRKNFCHIDGHIYSEMACNGSERPIDKEECTQMPCVYWMTDPWSECSASCGEGIQIRRVFCKNAQSGDIIDNQNCKHFLKPNVTKSCFTDCSIDPEYTDDIQDNYIHPQMSYQQYKWVTGPWTRCSSSCGRGIKTRKVVCKNEYGRENDYHCDQSERPIESIICNSQPCPKWDFSEWSACDIHCLKRRTVICRSVTGNSLDDSKCDKELKPYYTIRCKPRECRASSHQKKSDTYNNVKQRYKWVTSRFKPCSKICGRGYRKRSVSCRDRITQVDVEDKYCNSVRKPRNRKPCERYKCNYVWLEDPWSDCSELCGEGEKRRNVSCHKVFSNGKVNPDPLSKRQSLQFCNITEKPSTSVSCIQSNCNDLYVWKTGAWSVCSHSCGKKGKQVRHVYCVDIRNDSPVRNNKCPREFKPMRKRKCNQFSCKYSSCWDVKSQIKSAENNDYFLSVYGKTVLIHCFKMDTNQPEEFITLPQSRANYAEIYDKMLQNVEECPANGERLSNCPCSSGTAPKSGFTYFWKIRLNLTSLQIIADDFTFSAQNKGERVPYGSSGDCYSSIKGCFQGTFSIDLSETSFRLSPSVRWITNGPNASSSINSLDNGKRVQGKCGGYCGYCLPDSRTGLQLEVT